ncbi:RNA polymerase sigma factor [Peterkaempfera bronchialis]|uniref:RNA polymerase sigma factor n=1 Tax=Peterkaempfera bronchialis TaxID=2126346 RepID=UPI003C2DAADC
MPALADTRLRPAFAPLAAALARAHGLDAEDLEQAVWLRALEHTARAPLPTEPVGWLRSLTVREFHRALAPARAEIPTPLPPRPTAAPPGRSDLPTALRAAVPLLPARCPALLTALLDRPGLTYTQLAAETGIPRGSIGPTRSRCLACLRRLLRHPAASG